MIIHSTTNYDQFKILDCNRDIHIGNLLRSVNKKNMLKEHPIIVDIYMQVLDGQHRLAVAKQLQIPIYYIITDHITEEDIPQNQVQRPWTLDDYLKFYEKKSDDYRLLACLRNLTSFPTSLLVKLCGSGANALKARNFREGNFKLNSDVVSLEKKLLIIKELVSKNLKAETAGAIHNYIYALWRLVSRQDFDISRFKVKCENYKDLVEDSYLYRSIDKIYQSLVNLYNYNTSEKYRINLYS